DEARAMAYRYQDWGASIIDLGGQSSHYENPDVGVEVELARLLPAVELLAGEGFLVSVDTWKPAVAAAALEAGAVMVNDTGGLQDPAMRRVVADAGAATVMVYVEGDNPHAVGEVQISSDKAERTAAWFADRLGRLRAEGIERLVVDPGIALNYRGDYDAYTRMQLQVIRETGQLRALEVPVLIPIPRKRELTRVMAYVTLALEHGADLIRVHDVEAAGDLVRLFGREARPE
ncbi:MAG: dihydropteroate synthase, partial [Acidimicrobiia bacterium]